MTSAWRCSRSASARRRGARSAAQYFALGLARDQDPVAAHRYLGRLYEELFADPMRARQHYLAYLRLGGREEEVVARAYALAAQGDAR